MLYCSRLFLFSSLILSSVSNFYFLLNEFVPEALVSPHWLNLQNQLDDLEKKKQTQKGALQFKKANCETREDLMKTGCCHMSRFPHKHFLLATSLSNLFNTLLLSSNAYMKKSRICWYVREPKRICESINIKHIMAVTQHGNKNVETNLINSIITRPHVHTKKLTVTTTRRNYLVKHETGEETSLSWKITWSLH